MPRPILPFDTHDLPDWFVTHKDFLIFFFELANTYGDIETIVGEFPLTNNNGFTVITHGRERNNSGEIEFADTDLEVQQILSDIDIEGSIIYSHEKKRVVKITVILD